MTIFLFFCFWRFAFRIVPKKEEELVESNNKKSIFTSSCLFVCPRVRGERKGKGKEIKKKPVFLTSTAASVCLSPSLRIFSLSLSLSPSLRENQSRMYKKGNAIKTYVPIS